MSEFYHIARNDPAFTVAILGSFTCKLTSVSCSLFGNLLITSNEKANPKDPNENPEDRAKTLLQILFLVANIAHVPLSMIFGYLGDKVRVWYLIIFNNCFCLLFGVFMIIQINLNSPLMLTGFIGLYMFHQVVYMLVIKLSVIGSIVNHPSEQDCKKGIKRNTLRGF